MQVGPGVWWGAPLPCFVGKASCMQVGLGVQGVMGDAPPPQDCRQRLWHRGHGGMTWCGVQAGLGVQEFRDLGVQGFRGSGVQGCRGSGL